MNGWLAFALALVIWAAAVSLICLWVSAAARKAAPKLYDPQTSEPSFWAAPAAEKETRKRPKR